VKPDDAFFIRQYRIARGYFIYFQIIGCNGFEYGTAPSYAVGGADASKNGFSKSMPKMLQDPKFHSKNFSTASFQLLIGGYVPFANCHLGFPFWFAK